MNGNTRSMIKFFSLFRIPNLFCYGCGTVIGPDNTVCNRFPFFIHRDETMHHGAKTDEPGFRRVKRVDNLLMQETTASKISLGLSSE